MPISGGVVSSLTCQRKGILFWDGALTCSLPSSHESVMFSRSSMELPCKNTCVVENIVSSIFVCKSIRHWMIRVAKSFHLFYCISFVMGLIVACHVRIINMFVMVKDVRLKFEKNIIIPSYLERASMYFKINRKSNCA